MMLPGIILILAGILIALSPPLLAIIVASLMIIMGVLITMIAYYNRQLRKHYDNPAVEFFFRY